MLKVNDTTIAHLESQYPGISEQIRSLEDAQLPACPVCGSADTARVLCGVTGRTMHLVLATTKAALLASSPAAGHHLCHACKQLFQEGGGSTPTRGRPARGGGFNPRTIEPPASRVRLARKRRRLHPR